MKNLLYKEWKLARHPVVLIFPLFALMLLIPAYPYYVAFIYTCLEVFFIFLQGRETRDVFYTVTLPVAKRDVVKARVLFVVCIQLFQILISVPFAFLGRAINPNPGGNPVGIESNVAFFGFIFLMFGLFNLLFFPRFYKDGYSCGTGLLVAGSVTAVYILVLEVAVQAVPALKAFLDVADGPSQLRQLPILLAGMALYGLMTLGACKKSAKRFELVDL